MENITRKVERMVRGNAKRRLWQRAVAIPAAVVVFVTTYALILPAIAMERDTYCGMEEHVHTAECYEAVAACGYEDGQLMQSQKIVTELACEAKAHQHTEECFDEQGNLICGKADFLAHKHNEDCYVDGQLVCQLPEIEPHVHDDSCFVTETVNVCGLPEGEGHIHTEACYGPVVHTELVCGLAESEPHAHTEACYTTIENTYLACTLPEGEGHTHTETCYNENGELVCGLPEIQAHTHTAECYVTETIPELTCGLAESAGHTHSDDCYAAFETIELTCGLAESEGHTHTDDCFATETVQVCDKPEIVLHTHDENCLDENGALICGQTEILEHVHTADCFITREEVSEVTHQHTDLCYVQNLACDLPEHVHTDSCYVQPEEIALSEIEDTEPAAGEGETEIAEPAEPVTAPDYICGMEEHAHAGECFDENAELVCELPEHVHTESCLAAETVEIDDGLVEIEDAPVEIFEDETPFFAMPILVCGMEEHEHSTNCMDENMNYVCGVAPHTHTGDCYAIPGMDGVTPILVCELHEHFHTETCYNEAGELACGIEEHIHDVSCFQLPEGVIDPDAPVLPQEALQEKTFENNDVIITAAYGADAGIPETAELRAQKITAESDPERYAAHVAQTSAKLTEENKTANQLVIYSIGFYDKNNCEIEPLATVQVSIQFKNADGFVLDDTASVFHFTGDGIVEVLETSSDVANNIATFTTESF